jgi:hypothetical protein
MKVGRHEQAGGDPATKVAGWNGTKPAVTPANEFAGWEGTKPACAG